MKRLLVALLAFGLTSSSLAQSITGGGGGGSGGGGSGTVTSIDTACGLSGGPITTSGTIQGAAVVRAATGTTDTILSTDCGKVVTESNGAAVAVTLPQATGSFTAPFFYTQVNLGVGTVTITPTTSTINGAATLVLTTGQSADIISDGTNYIAALGKTGTQTIASGTSALGTSAISSAACATAVTTAATGTATTDVITAGFNGDPTAVTGYIPLTAGMLTIIAYPTANNVNFKVCNNTTASITPGAITLNWRVVR